VCVAVDEMALVESLQHFCTKLNTFLIAYAGQVILIDPGEFRAVDEQFQKITKGKGTLEILDMQVRAADDETL